MDRRKECAAFVISASAKVGVCKKELSLRVRFLSHQYVERGMCETPGPLEGVDTKV